LVGDNVSGAYHDIEGGIMLNSKRASQKQYETIDVEKKKKEMVGVVTLNRPPHNRVTLQLMQDVLDAVARFDADPDVRVIMIRGAGKDFSRGGDVEELAACKGWEANQFFMTVAEMAKALRRATKVTIAVCHGWTTAAGMVTAMSCDLVVAAEDTLMGSTAIDFGLLCPWGPIAIMPRQIGLKKSFELGVTGCLLSAEELLARGVVNRVVPLDKLDEEAMKLAAVITSKSPTAVLLHKRLFYAAQDMEYTKALDFGAATMVQYHQTEEAQEGMRAFLENRAQNLKVTGYSTDFSVRRKGGGNGVPEQKGVVRPLSIPARARTQAVSRAKSLR
jgi:enoyl-CoA hydratase/carnithine racemase